MSMWDECERCSARVGQKGDHTCAQCANLLGRSVRDPFWGDFANHPDSLLLVGSELSRGNLFFTFIDRLLEGSRHG
jgi:hypothetical protein